ncbi:peptide transporter MTD1 [Chytriomyces cf. hyalinus JEL632]|nr:peptide transporter MTD1 [Chytriomyces cf. hyalinus JEL632]
MTLVAPAETKEEFAAAHLDDEAPKDDLDLSNEIVDDYGVGMVANIVSLEDDPDTPVLTFRYFVLSLLLSMFAGTLGQIYYFKPQTLVVSTLFLQLFGYFGGVLMAKILPIGTIFNPDGKFNKKEHALITVTASTAATAALATELVAVEYLYYDNLLPHWIGILLVLSSQLIGYGFAGLFRETLVYPRATYYPSLLAQVSLYENLHSGAGISKHMTKYFFTIVAVIFVYEWLPNWIAPSLIGFSIICITTGSQKNPVLTNIFGGINNNEGMGMFAFCFDWNNISSNTLTWPWVTQVNYMIGVACCCIFMPFLYYTNTWNAKTFPFMGQSLYDNQGNDYDQTLILDANHNLNNTALQELGVPFLASSNAWYYLGSNLSVTAGVVHILLYHWKELVEGFKNTFSKKGESTNTDPYYTVMLKYNEVPMWWYLTVLGVFFGVGLFITQYNKSGLDWYFFIIALCLSAFFIFLCGFISATTGFGINVQTIIQLIGGFIKPGNPVSNMYFTLYGYNATSQANAMLADLKLGQYMKIPPRCVFFAQLFGATVGSIFNYMITVSIMTQQSEILLSANGSPQWSGQNIQGFNTLAVSWGALGKQMYGVGATYEWVSYAFILGFFLPLPFYLLHRFFPKVGFNYINFAILPWFFGYLSVGTNTSIMTAMIIGVFTQFYLRRYKPIVFNKYQYITSAALDAGTQFCVFFVTLLVQGAIYKPVDFPIWWLNPDPSGIWFPDGCYNAANDVPAANATESR